MRLPPAILLVLVFEAGLATGLSRFPAPSLVLFTAAAAALVLHRRSHDWLPAVLLLGFVLGTVSRATSEHSCAARLPAAPLSLAVELLEPASDGVAAARPLGRSCSGWIAVRFRADKLLPAGTRWIIEGRWIPERRFGGRPSGLLVVRKYFPRPSSPGPVAELRTWLTRSTKKLYGTRAGLVDALLVGSRGGIDPELKAAFARSGLVHLLSISGFHVGIIFGWALLALRLLRVRRGAAAAAATVLMLLYVTFLGWPAPAARASLLCAVGAASFARQRHPRSFALLALTCLGVTLLDPWALFDLGGWLSAAAFWGAMAFTRWSDRAGGQGGRWLAPRRMLFASSGATLATAPLTASAFGSVPLAGIALNFAAIPLAALAVPAVLGSVVSFPVLPALAVALAAGGGLGLAGLETLARAGSVLPLGVAQSAGGPLAAVPWVAALGLALWAMGRRNTSRRAALRAGWILAAGAVVSALPARRLLSADEGSRLTLHFLSVGQGDAALIRTPSGRWILIDAGPADGRHDAGRDIIRPFLIQHGVTRLAAFVLSHAHLDHVGGALAVLRDVPVDLILEPAEPVAEPHYLGLLDLAAERGYRWIAGRAGDSLAIDGVSIRLLHPDTTWARWREDLNDDSVVLLVRSGAFEAVFAGDLGVRAESLLAGRVGRVDLLKVGHHGSAGSSGGAWLKELSPKAAVVSVGPNRYGHPSPAALRRLALAGVAVWRTDRDGTVRVTVLDSSMLVRGRRAARQYPLRP
ncbi:MAG TPA: DNA internalization-related competence protein ComEC/Rec2 [Gemmatimonadales bacterium]|nr:DNA internalization-related competence protein ComEC/Rec2 [Gemmatimonadales bacterium]